MTLDVAVVVVVAIVYETTAWVRFETGVSRAAQVSFFFPLVQLRLVWLVRVYRLRYGTCGRYLARQSGEVSIDRGLYC